MYDSTLSTVIFARFVCKLVKLQYLDESDWFSVNVKWMQWRITATTVVNVNFSRVFLWTATEEKNITSNITDKNSEYSRFSDVTVHLVKQ